MLALALGVGLGLVLGVVHSCLHVGRSSHWFLWVGPWRGWLVALVLGVGSWRFLQVVGRFVLVIVLVLGVVGCLGGSSRSFLLVFPWRGLLGSVAWVGRRVGPWRFLALRWSLALVLGVGPWHWSLALVLGVGRWRWLVLASLALGVGCVGPWRWSLGWCLALVGSLAFAWCWLLGSLCVRWSLGQFVSVGLCVGPWRGGLLGSVVVVALVLLVS